MSLSKRSLENSPAFGMTPEAWDTFDGLFKALEKQGRRVEELERRLGLLTRRLEAHEGKGARCEVCGGDGSAYKTGGVSGDFYLPGGGYGAVDVTSYACVKCGAEWSD